MNAQPLGFSNPPLPGSPARLAQAHSLLWLIFLLMVVTVGIGASWDKAYDRIRLSYPLTNSGLNRVSRS